jgi:hypothetical protein
MRFKVSVHVASDEYSGTPVTQTKTFSVTG